MGSLNKIALSRKIKIKKEKWEMTKREREKRRLWTLEHEKEEEHDENCCDDNSRCRKKANKFLETAKKTLLLEKGRRKIRIEFPCGCCFAVHAFRERNKKETYLEFLYPGYCEELNNFEDGGHLQSCDCVSCEIERETEICVHGCDRVCCGVCGDD